MQLQYFSENKNRFGPENVGKKRSRKQRFTLIGKMELRLFIIKIKPEGSPWNYKHAA